MHMVAFGKDERERWRHTSMLAFQIGRFGNSDPKKYPSSIKKYMPELWAEIEENDLNDDPLVQAAKRLKQKNNGR